MALSRGSVVVLRRNGVDGLGLIWRARGDELVVLPICGTNGPPRHRAEVQITDLGDIVACGISIAKPVVMCHKARKTTQASLRDPEPVGTAPLALVARVGVALTKELIARQAEDRLSFMAVEAFA
jgi:hypothetical protein